MELISVYWIIFIITGTYFLSSLLGIDGDSDVSLDTDGATDLDLDGEADATDSPKIFSLRVLAGGLMGFAIGGASLHYGGHSLGWQLVGGFGVAILLAILSYYLAKGMNSMQGNSNFSMFSLLHSKGFITVGSPIAGGNAMVTLATSSGPREYICSIKDKRIKLKTGDFVEVLEQVGTQLIVDRVKEEKQK